MNPLAIGIGFVSVLFYLLYRRHKIMREKLPPGPPSIPLIGSLPFVKNRKRGHADAILHKSLYKYDPDLYTMWLGSIPLIVIQNFKLAKELFAGDEFSGRPTGFHNQYVRGIGGECMGIVMTMGRFWQDQRRFTLKHLKDLGFGRKTLDTIIQDEIKCLIENLSLKAKDGDVLIDTIFNFPIINILWQIVASKKYDPNLLESKTMMKKISKIFQVGPPALDYILQPVRYFLPLFKVDQMTLDLKNMFREQVQELEHEYNVGEEPRNFIELYLREIHQQQNTPHVSIEGKYSNFNTEQLATICLDFFQVGSETSSTTLSWAVMYLSLNPDVQEICLKEIEKIIGGK